MLGRLSFVAGILAATAAAPACSVCIAHALGSGLQVLGGQTLPRGTTVVGVEFLTFRKSNAIEEGTERHTQTEVELVAFHGLTDRLMLRGRLPYVVKSLEATGEDKSTVQGLGDASLGLTFQLPPSFEAKVLVALTMDVKLPTGANSLKDGDVLKEEHLQLGTGSTDFSLGALATWEQGGGTGFAGLRGRVNGSNGRGFRYGSALFYNLGYSHPLDKDSGLVVEFNGRFAAKDRLEEGGDDANSGGHIGYLSAAYRRNLGEGRNFVLGYQLPVLKNLNGTQSETGLLSASVSQRF